MAARNVFESYVKQMIGCLEMTKKPCPSKIINAVKSLYGPKGGCFNFEELIEDVFLPLRDLIPEASYVVDGLDECELPEVRKVLSTFRKLALLGQRIFISGREILDVRNAIPESVALVISEEDTREDIRRFIDWRIEEKMRERCLTERESVLQDIKHELNEKADRM